MTLSPTTFPAVTALLHARPDLATVLPLACVMAQVAVSA